MFYNIQTKKHHFWRSPESEDRQCTAKSLSGINELFMFHDGVMLRFAAKQLPHCLKVIHDLPSCFNASLTETDEQNEIKHTMKINGIHIW